MPSRRRGLAVVQLVSMLLGLTGGPASAASPEGSCCQSPEDAFVAFQEGVRLYFSGANDDEVQELLCRSACCEREPRTDELFTVRRALTVRYLPYFYLGLALDRAGDDCNALKNFNLSRCKGGVDSRPDRLEELEEMRRDLLRRRRLTPPAYAEGLRAYQQGDDWSKVAQKMLEAIEAWDEDGELPKDRRWPGPLHDLPPHYLPRYYLARALLELGCYQQAAAVIECSELSRCQLADDPRESPREVQRRSIEAVEQGKLENPQCRRWQAIEAKLGNCCQCVACGAP